MMNPPTITTKRLILRPIALEDAEALFLVYSHPLAMRFWHTPSHTSVADTRLEITSLLCDTACWWSLYHRGDARVIGTVGFLGNDGVPGMGYILHPDYWHQGYMTEAVGAALDYRFNHLGLDRVELWINDDNVPSQKLAQRNRFTRRGRFRSRYSHNASAHDTLVYGLYAREWQGSSGSVHPNQTQFYSLEPVLSVHNVQATADYYRDLLGFTINFLYGEPPSHGAVFRGEWTGAGADIQLSQAQHTTIDTTSVSLYITVGPDIDDLYAQYQERGVQIMQPIASQPWGRREFSLQDCNGYVLRFGAPI